MVLVARDVRGPWPAVVRGPIRRGRPARSRHRVARLVRLGVLTSQNLRNNRRIGYVPDQPQLYDKLTGREFLEQTVEEGFVRREHRALLKTAGSRAVYVTCVQSISSPESAARPTYSTSLDERRPCGAL